MKTVMIAALAVLAGCATTMSSPELTRAETEYLRASRGSAAQVAPNELLDARMALESAQQAHRNHPGSQAARDLAYVAERKAELAEARAQLELDRRRKAQADGAYKVSLARANPQTKVEIQVVQQKADEAERLRLAEAERARLAEAERARLAEANRRAAEAGAAEANARADAEARAREEAERRAAAAKLDLARIVEIRETERGTVLTLAGDLLFEFDRSTLLPTAPIKLNQLAEALKETDQQLAIEGHCDWIGSDAYNQDLSYRRAMAVRDYLASRGVPAERLKVAGFGKTRPIADNRSPEGRAMNRRVEIIVERSTAHR